MSEENLKSNLEYYEQYVHVTNIILIYIIYMLQF